MSLLILPLHVDDFDLLLFPTHAPVLAQIEWTDGSQLVLAFSDTLCVGSQLLQFLLILRLHPCEQLLVDFVLVILLLFVCLLLLVEVLKHLLIALDKRCLLLAELTLLKVFVFVGL